MSLFRELNEQRSPNPDITLSHAQHVLFERYEYNTIHHARRLGKSGSQTAEPDPVLDLVQKEIQDLTQEGYQIKRDGVTHRRLGWEISKPTWKEGTCLYLNFYKSSSFNTQANEAMGSWCQAWTRWFDSKGIPRLGKRFKFDMTQFDQQLRNMIREFELFQESL